MNENLNDEAALSPQEMLDLVSRSQTGVARRMARLIPWILITWGFVWLVGFVLLWAAVGPGMLPVAVAAWAFGILMAIAIVASMVIGIRAGAGTRDNREESLAGMLFGFASTAGFIGVGVIGGALARVGMSSDVAMVFYPTMYGLMVGILYLAAGAVWRAPYPAYIGAWLALVSVVTAFVPAPAHYLVLGIAGGGGFLAAGIAIAAWAWKRVK